MFIGQFKHNLDDKGRLVLPTKFRESLSEGAVITKGYEGCLMIYTKESWEQTMNDLLSKPMTNVAVRRTIRNLTGNASEVELDKSGRTNIPNFLLELAGINKDVTIVGVGSYVEVWATEKWLQEQEIDGEEFESDAEQLSQFNK